MRDFILLKTWKYIKNHFKNRSFDSLEHLKQWVNQFVAQMKEETIKSIVSNHNYLNTFSRIHYP